MRSGINGSGVGSGITAPGSGITTLGIGISSVFVESGIKIVNIFGIRDQNSQCFCDQGLKFSTFLWSGIKIWGKNTGSVMKKNTLLRPWSISLPTSPSDNWISPVLALPLSHRTEHNTSMVEKAGILPWTNWTTLWYQIWNLHLS